MRLDDNDMRPAAWGQFQRIVLPKNRYDVCHAGQVTLMTVAPPPQTL
jgi:hypothetical protein